MFNKYTSHASQKKKKGKKVLEYSLLKDTIKDSVKPNETVLLLYAQWYNK